jgi:RHS repeat-associated protein
VAPPTGTTLPTYTQAYSYDSLDRLTSSSAGTYSYSDPNHVHAATSVSSIPNQYAAYDAMGNMTCRNTAAGTGHTCAGSNPIGAAMSYNSQGQLASWTAPSGKVGNASYLYDTQGTRVLTTATNGSGTTDTIDFDGYTETVLSGGTTTTTKYYNANGERIAVKVGGNQLHYLISDPLGSNSMALNSSGQVVALQHYSPYGTVDYSWGTMPTSYNYADQRLDSQAGLLYDNFRYYDPLTGRYVRADNVQDNSSGMDPYAYVGDNPETRNDPSGHCWPWCTALIGAAVGAVVGVAVTTVQSLATTGKLPSTGEVLQSAVTGAVSGAIIGVTGPGAGLVAAIGIGALSGAVGNVAGQVVNNVVAGKHVADGVVQAGVEGAVIGGLTGGLFKGGSLLLNRFAGRALPDVVATLVDGIRSLSTKVGDFTGLSGSDYSDIVDRIPSSARSLEWKTSENIPDGGSKWRWGSNPVWRLEIHGPDLNPQAGPNVSSGWIFRVQEGHNFMDDAGIWWKDNIGNENSPFYNSDAWNDTHIPMHGPQP